MIKMSNNSVSKEKVITNNKSLYYLLYFYLLILITIVMTDNGVSAMRNIAFAGIITLAVLIKPVDVFVLMTAALPLAEIARLGSTQLTLLPFLAALFLTKVLFARKSHKITNIVPLLIIGVISVLNGLIRWSSAISSLVFIMTWLIPFFAYEIKADIITNKNILFISYIISAIISIYCSILFPTASNIISNNEGNYYRTIGFSNAWSYAITLIIAASFVLLLYNNSKKHVIVSLGAVTLFIYQAIGSGTFSAVIGICIVLIFTAVILSQKKKALLLLLIPVLVFIAYAVWNGFIEIRGDVSDNGRIAIWKFYLGKLQNDFSIMLFGVGGGSIASYASSQNVLTAHNGFLEMIIELGIIGTVLLISYVIRLIKASGIKILNNAYTVPLWIYLSFLLTQGGASSYTMVILITILICMSVNQSYGGIKLVHK